MKQLPSIELLESVHDFPGPYLFKVIGHAEDSFLARAVIAVREALGIDEDPPFSIRQSSGGKHVALSFDLEMKSAEEVLVVYRRLVKLEGLVALF